MSDINGGNDDDRAGYGRPPKHGRIKPGEKRNPWGRRGKPRGAKDACLAAAEAAVNLSAGGKVISITAEEGMYKRLVQMALAGNIAAARLVLERLDRRRPPPPPVSTAEELAREEEEMREKRELSARLVSLLEEEAERKLLGPVINKNGDDQEAA